MVDNKFSIDLNRVIRGMEDRDESIALELSELALRFKREDMLPVLIKASSFCKSALFTQNVLRLLAVFHHKYLSTIVKYESDDDLTIRKLANELHQSIAGHTLNTEIEVTVPKLTTDPVLLSIQRQFSVENQNQIESEIEQLRLQSEDWTEHYTQNYINLVIRHCFELTELLSAESKKHILKFLTELRVDYFRTICARQIKEYSGQKLEKFLKFLAEFDNEHLLGISLSSLEHYDGSSNEQKWLSSMMLYLRCYPDIHLQFLDRCISVCEYDTTLIKEVSEASFWKGTDTVATLLTWMSRISNEDLKFRIVRSLDRLVTFKDLQLLRNTISITENERDQRILNNILQLVESKYAAPNKPNQKKTIANPELELSTVPKEMSTFGYQIALTLVTLVSLGLSGFILGFGYQDYPISFSTIDNPGLSLNQFSENKAKMIQDLLRKGSSIETFECRSRVIRVQPLRILCNGVSVDITNGSSDFLNLNTVDTIKVKLTNWKLVDPQMFMTKAAMQLLQKEVSSSRFPYIGPITN